MILLVGAGRFERPTPCAQAMKVTRYRELLKYTQWLSFLSLPGSHRIPRSTRKHPEIRTRFRCRVYTRVYVIGRNAVAGLRLILRPFALRVLVAWPRRKFVNEINTHRINPRKKGAQATEATTPPGWPGFCGASKEVRAP